MRTPAIADVVRRFEERRQAMPLFERPAVHLWRTLVVRVVGCG
jgi:hypothetical protein